jgi:hypothetical protein
MLLNVPQTPCFSVSRLIHTVSSCYERLSEYNRFFTRVATHFNPSSDANRIVIASRISCAVGRSHQSRGLSWPESRLDKREGTWSRFARMTIGPALNCCVGYFRVPALWMGCDCNDGDNGNSLPGLDFIRAVVPKNAVSTGSVALSICLEHLLTVCTG